MNKWNVVGRLVAALALLGAFSTFGCGSGAVDEPTPNEPASMFDSPAGHLRGRPTTCPTPGTILPCEAPAPGAAPGVGNCHHGCGVPEVCATNAALLQCLII
jgi:hypothetical protein